LGDGFSDGDGFGDGDGDGDGDGAARSAWGRGGGGGMSEADEDGSVGPSASEAGGYAGAAGPGGAAGPRAMREGRGGAAGRRGVATRPRGYAAFVGRLQRGQRQRDELAMAEAELATGGVRQGVAAAAERDADGRLIARSPGLSKPRAVVAAARAAAARSGPASAASSLNGGRQPRYAAGGHEDDASWSDGSSERGGSGSSAGFGRDRARGQGGGFAGDVGSEDGAWRGGGPFARSGRDGQLRSERSDARLSQFEELGTDEDDGAGPDGLAAHGREVAPGRPGFDPRSSGDPPSVRQRAREAARLAREALPQLPPWRMPPPGAWAEAVALADAAAGGKAVAAVEVDAPAPLVYLDLALGGGQSERIPVWRDTDPSQVAKLVARARSLSTLMETRLRQWMESEQASALGQ